MKEKWWPVLLIFVFKSFAYSQIAGGGETLYIYGRSYYAQENCEKALQYFQLAEKEGYISSDLIYMSGVCYFRTKEFDRALKYLLKASENPNFSQPSFYFAGLCFYEKGKMDRAADYFKRVVQINPSNFFGKNANNLLKRLQKARPVRPYYFKGSINLEYDTNVAVYSRNQEFILKERGIDFQKEGLKESARLSGGLRYIFFKRLETHAEMNVYQSFLNPQELRDFNITSLEGSAGMGLLLYSNAVSIKSSLDYSYARDLLGFEDYYQGHAVSPSIHFGWSRRFITRFFYLYRFDDYYGLFRRGSPRDANVNGFGFTFTFVISPDLTAMLDSNFEHNSAYSDEFRFNGINSGFYITYSAPYEIKLTASASYTFRDYMNHPAGRNDNIQTYSILLQKIFFKHFSSGISYIFTKNNTGGDYEYKREIISLQFSGSI